MITKELLDAYLSTVYKVYNPPMELRIGEYSHEIDSLLQAQGNTSWAFITAFNPYSRFLTDSENERRHEELKSFVNEYAIYEGEGVGEDKRWKSEKSLLIIGISTEEAMKLGKEFEQNAIVFGEIYHPAELNKLFD